MAYPRKGEKYHFQRGEGGGEFDFGSDIQTDDVK
jgi:hypothetical protein